MPDSDTEGQRSSWTPERLKRGAVVLVIIGVSILYCLGIGGLVLRQRLMRPTSPTATMARTVAVSTSTPLPAIDLPGQTLEPTPTQGTLVFPTADPTTLDMTPTTEIPNTPDTAISPTTTATGTPSPTSTCTATPTPTPTDTPAPTDTPTPSPTETSTEAPSETAPEVPTATPDTSGSLSTGISWVLAPRA